jgi:hypothetical protein
VWPQQVHRLLTEAVVEGHMRNLVNYLIFHVPISLHFG